MLVPLLLALTSGSSAWADRDHGSRGYGNQDPYKQRPLNFTAEEQRPIIPAPPFSSRQTRDWNQRDERYRGSYERDSGYRQNDYRDESRDGFYRRNDGYQRVDERGNDAVYQRLHDNRRQDDTGYYQRGSQRPVNDVIREVQNRYGGQVIGVQNSDGGMYRVRVLQRDGRVKNVLVPAE